VKEIEYWLDQDVGSWIVFRWFLEREDEVVSTRLMWLRIRTCGESYEFLSAFEFGLFSSRAQLQEVNVSYGLVVRVPGFRSRGATRLSEE
jgi:hypothetical protein